jgi:enoyl-CoA hydratase/carnithine racemase/predicted GIY-YIG superfamily endonuclease
VKSYFVYIMAGIRRTIYIGFTGRLGIRVKQHKEGEYPDSFSAKYQCHKLVYYESYSSPHTALARETELKGWTREKKVALIEAVNPKWVDLAADWGKKMSLPEIRRILLRRVGSDSSSGSRPPQNDTVFRTQIGESQQFIVQGLPNANLLRLASSDSTNRLGHETLLSLVHELEILLEEDSRKPLIITGNPRYFSVGADLNEINQLTAPVAFEFAQAGQRLMRTIAEYPSPVFAFIEGHCMGGGLDLALACHRRICAPNAIFGHRGAALGLMTGWGGTQRLPRLIGKGRAMQMFLAAEKLSAQQALAAGLVEAVVEDPVTYITDTLLRSL